MSFRPLSKELQEVAINELNEDPDRILDDLKFIRKWAEEKPHITIRADDQWLVNFLRGCGYDLELAKSKLDLLYTIRPLTPEFFSNRDPFLPEIQELLEMGVVLPLPKLSDPKASRAAIIRIEPADPTKHRLENGIKLASMILDISRNEDDNLVICGAHILMDVKGLTFKHLLQVTPNIIRKGIRCFVDASSSRPRGIHVINAPVIAYKAFNALKYLANSKILNMIKFYSKDDMDKIYETIPLSVLPTEYGGEGPSLKDLTVRWKEKVESYRDWFIEDEQYFSFKTESPKKLAASEDSCNLTGVFSKLEFD